MKKSRLLWLAVLLLVVVPVAVVRNSRSVRHFIEQRLPPSHNFDREQSVALFVGVRNFTHDKSLTSVRYAPDDAVDLAYTFALDPNAVNLVRPEHVAIALSGQPHKEKSKERLKALKEAGATVVMQTDPSDLLKLLRDRAALAGRDGLFIVSFATHGFSLDGVPYLLGASSFFEDVETTLSAAKVMEIVARSGAARSLIFLDACREYVKANSRSGLPEPLSAAPLIRAMRKVEGQVVFYAADTGGYAYDNPMIGNGVFTAAVIDGLQCRAGRKRNMVTVGTLAKFVEDQVLDYVRRNHNPAATKATQLSTEGSTEMMPLALCRAPTLAAQTLIQKPAASLKAVVVGSTLTVFDSDGKPLWSVGPEHFQVGHAFRNTTREYLVIKDDRVFLFDENGQYSDDYQHDGPVHRAELVRETSRRAPKIVVTARSSQYSSRLHIDGPVSTVFMLHPKRMNEGPLWYGALVPAGETIARFKFDDYDKNGEGDIALTTSTGNVLHLDFHGQTISTKRGKHGIARFQLLAQK